MSFRGGEYPIGNKTTLTGFAGVIGLLLYSVAWISVMITIIYLCYQTVFGGLVT